MTPTKDPLTELAARLTAVGGPDALAVRDGLARHPDQAPLAIRSAVLAAAVRDGAEPPGPDDGAARLVLIVDQFEQVFTLSPDPGGEAARQAFITALCAAATPVPPRAGRGSSLSGPGSPRPRPRRPARRAAPARSTARPCPDQIAPARLTGEWLSVSVQGS